MLDILKSKLKEIKQELNETNSKLDEAKIYVQKLTELAHQLKGAGENLALIIKEAEEPVKDDKKPKVEVPIKTDPIKEPKK